MPLKLSNKDCSTCPSAQDPSLPGHCNTVGEVNNALNSSSVHTPACIDRINNMVARFSGQVSAVTRV
jgi:hypothetical protein